MASPQVFGDQTDVPESGDWWDAGYLIMWGSNVPVTRTPDAHWMTEARYRGQKVVVVSPDYADNVKFADEWLMAAPGTDGALAMAMGHVVLKEFFVDRQVDYFVDYCRRFTDLPFLVTLDPDDAGDAFTPGKFLTAADLDGAPATSENAAFKTVLIDPATGEPVVPNGSLGHRYGDEGLGRWNLELGDVVPALTLLDEGQAVTVRLPRFDTATGDTATDAAGPTWCAGCPPAGSATGGDHGLRPAAGPVRGGPRRSARRVADRLRRSRGPYTPAWQESITGGTGRRPWPGSPASSPATPRRPRAAR